MEQQAANETPQQPVPAGDAVALLVAFMDAEEWVEEEAHRCKVTGQAWSSAPTIMRIKAVERMAAALGRPSPYRTRT